MTQVFCSAHNQRSNSAKLSELRRKTDRQLTNLVHSKLDEGLSFAVLAEVEQSVGSDAVAAERSFERADQALAEVQKLLPALNREQRRIVEPKLNDLRRVVDRLSRMHEISGAQTAAILGGHPE